MPCQSKTSNTCNKTGHLANICRSSSSTAQGSQVKKLHRMSQVKLCTDPKPALPRSEPIHFKNAEDCVGVTDFGTVDDNFTMCNGVIPEKATPILHTTPPMNKQTQW